MQEVFQKATRDRIAVLRVFCLCSDEYAKHLAGYDITDEEKAPRISVEATGYPHFRAFIAGGPSTGRWNILKHHIQTCYDTLFSTLEMASTMTKNQQKDKLIELSRVKQQVCLLFNCLGWHSH